MVSWMGDAFELLRFYRLIFPRSRAVRPFRYYHNSSARKSMQCVFCREVGPTWCAKYPKTCRAVAWEDAHSCNSLLGILDQMSEAYN